MNRLERLLWEESNVTDIAKQTSRRGGWAKGVSVALLVAAFALLAARPWPPSFADARVESAAAKTAAAQAASGTGPQASAKAPGAVVRAHGVKVGERASQ